MKEQLKQFVADKRGVSPVIGVVLMVAVVVILAAVIGAFVLGLGGNQQDTPQASFSVDGEGNVVFESGDDIDPANIEVTASGSGTPKLSDDTSDLSAPISPGDAVASNADGVGTVRVVYTGSGQSATIWQTEV